MDIFKPGLDAFCTPQGRAQDRIPSDLSQAATQQGTVLGSAMMNGPIFEIVNAIKALGETPDRAKEDQLATGLMKMISTDQVGRINRWACDSEHLPAGEVILLGGEIDPADFVDDLATLKERCPDWVQPGGKIKLPNYDRYYGVMDIARPVGNEQQDAMQNWSNNFSQRTQSEGNASVGTGNINSGAPAQKFELSSVARTANETRPRNINEIHTVTVGRPKSRKSPKKFYLLNEQGVHTNQQITLYQGESGAYIGFNPKNMSETGPIPFSSVKPAENPSVIEPRKSKKNIEESADAE